METEAAELPKVAVSFKKAISALSVHLSQDEYTVLLHELRGQVRHHKLHLAKPGDFDKEIVRDIAAAVALPAHLKASGKVVGIAGGIIGGLGAVSFLGPMASIAGGVVSVSSALWSGDLPRSISRVKWFRPAIRWELEDQAEKRE